MNEKILVFNTGSSTLKYKLFETLDSDLVEIKKGIIESIGTKTGPQNHVMALSILFQGFGLSDPSLAKIENLIAIGHRVVHGGSEFNETTLITREVIERLKKYNLNAPLHNPHIIEVMQDVFEKSGTKGHRDIPNYAVFDSAFFNALPDVSKVYPLPYELYENHDIRKFGFHGISHKYATNIIRSKYPNANNIISIHLGAGSSITATKNGKPIDTSMGFTPLEGLMMTTRSGDIDAGIIHYLIEKKILRHPEVDTLLNYKSGILGVSGVSSDMREVLHTAAYPMEDPSYKPRNRLEYVSSETQKRARLAIDMFVYKIKKYIGAYAAILGGCDVLILTGAMSNGSSFIRNKILENMEFILKDSKIEVVETDEEKQIAKEILTQYRK